MKFPVFHGGIAPLDSKGRGKVVEIDVPIECAGVRIESGDLVFGDVDGVVVVPRKIEEAVLARALDKVSSENVTRDELRSRRQAQGRLRPPRCPVIKRMTIMTRKPGISRRCSPTTGPTCMRRCSPLIPRSSGW